MLEIYDRLGIDCDQQIDEIITLSHEQREKGRIRAIAHSGNEIRIFLERGHPILVGEVLRSHCGKHIRVEGAVEPLTTATCDDWTLFSRACYHLGNRHVKIQIGERWLRIIPDHVLEDMLLQLGLTLTTEHAVFIPESGAYKHAHHDHAHHDH